jgi:hypothetical protein
LLINDLSRRSFVEIYLLCSLLPGFDESLKVGPQRLRRLLQLG